MAKNKKKTDGRTLQVPQGDSRETHQVPDNPPLSPIRDGIGDQLPNLPDLRRSSRILAVASETLGNGNGSDQARVELRTSSGDTGRDRDLQYYSDEDEESPRKSSDLTPFDGEDERRSKSISEEPNKAKSNAPQDSEAGRANELNERRVLRIKKLERDLYLAAERLREAQGDDQARANSPAQSRQSNQYGLTEADDNIIQAMRNLHSPTRGSNEASVEFNARLAASQRLRKDIEDSDRERRKRFRQQEELLAEVKRLRQEHKNYENDRRQHKAAKRDRESKRSRKNAKPDREMRRREHYREWLATQVVLDTMREGDLNSIGYTNIPARDKRAGYPGYPRSDQSDRVDRNATPGPSRPQGGNDRENSRDIRDHNNDQRSDAPRDNAENTRMGGDPSDPGDDSSSDSTYRPSRSDTTVPDTDTTSTNDEGGDSPRDQRHSGNRRRKRRRTRRGGHRDPSDSSSSSEDDRSRRSSRRHQRGQTHDDPRSTRQGTRSTRTRQDTRERSYPQYLGGENVDDDDNREDGYEAEIMRRYRSLIHDRVGRAREQLPDIKNIRVSPPDKYSGEDDIEKFDTWLAGLLRWYRVYNVTGNEKDTMRVDLCGTALTDLAATWYADEVEAWNRRTRYWYFEDLICAMYKRFIHEVTAQNAASSYKKTRFSRSKGALAFFNDLQRHASRMVQPPDEYSMKRKFLQGLPDDLVENLLKSRRVSAEHTSIEKLLREVKAMESSIQAYHNYKNERSERSVVLRSTTSTSNPQQNNTNNRTTRVVRFVKRNTGSYPSRNFQNNRDSTPNRSQPKTNYRPGGSGGHNAQKSGTRQSTPRPHNHQHKPRDDTSGKKATPLEEVECYLCHRMGHYASNCPDRPRVFAAQVIDEDNESPPNVEEEKQEHEHVPEDPTTEDNDVPDDPQGSQYESDREEYPLEEYEEYVEIDGDEDEDADVVYIRSGRITDDGDVTDDIADTSSVSDSASTLVGSTNTSMDLAEIPPGMTPYEVLLSLPEDARIEIYTRRKTEEEPNWTPPHNIIDVERRKKSPIVSNRMLHMGYSWDDEVYDSEWIQSLAVREPNEFQELTGYRVPTQILCESCGECTPDIREMIFGSIDGEAYTRTVIRCTNDQSKVIIRAMTDTLEPTRAYRSSMRRPVGTMSRPERRDGEQLCLAAYIKINGVNAYTLFDSGSTTDAVSPDFTRIANIAIYELEKPLTLQLGCAGSRSKINFGTESMIEFNSIAKNTYLDVANLDKYDSILGTPFLRKHGIMLDFENQEIIIRGKQRISALPEGEGAAAVNKPRKK